MPQLFAHGARLEEGFQLETRDDGRIDALVFVDFEAHGDGRRWDGHILFARRFDLVAQAFQFAPFGIEVVSGYAASVMA